MSDHSRLWRSRWAAVGAALAVTLGGGGLVAVNAASSPPASVVMVDPVRILDTRTGVGLSGRFESGVSRKLQVTGVSVPAGASGVLLNVTVVGPSAGGFLSVRPGDATGAPSTSSLNFEAGAVVPNSVQVGLPTSGANVGQVDIIYVASHVTGPTTEVLADVVGYLMAGGAGPAGSAGMSFINHYEFNSSTEMGVASAVPDAPDGYSATVNLAAGRYLVSGDLTVYNNATTRDGTATCQGYVDNGPEGQTSQQSIVERGKGNLALSYTFVLPTSGSTVVDFRCVKSGTLAGIPSEMYYWNGNMTIYKVD